MESRTAGIIIIGDEILKGHVRDTNSYFLCKRLHLLGVKVRKISVVTDSVDDIAGEVSSLSEQFDFVITTGGIGPTHDDVTYKGIAAAFNEPLVLNRELKTYWRQYCKNNCSFDSARVMSSIPKSGEIIWIKSNDPGFFKMTCIIKVSNVFVFPGVPDILQFTFLRLEKEYFCNKNCVFFTRRVYTNRDECDIVEYLNKAVVKFKENVVFGSYPVMGNDIYQTEVTLESTSVEEVNAAEKYLRSEIPSSWLVTPPLLDAEMSGQVYQLAETSPDKRFASVLKNAIKTIEEGLDKYPADTIFVSFNGGKDCTALLHLVAAVWQHKSVSTPIQSIYFRTVDPFPEVEAFMQDAVKRYKVEFTVIPGPIKQALAVLLQCKPHLRAALMGTRRSDPYSENLSAFQMTDPGWPQFMRVNPMLDWSYQDVWTFIQQLSVPYCTLYDLGYTSIGNRNNTGPNPNLRYIDNNGITRYKPAYCLLDEKVEREGRM